MSSRELTGVGDLIPQDVAEVFAQERSAKRGRRKRSKSLGRAFGWLSRKKKKDINANGESVGMGAGLDLAIDGLSAGHQGGQKGAPKAGKHPGKQVHPQGNTHAGQKDEEKEKTQLFQENVFIEGSRPKHLEDLHIEAQEGLKLMQQEEINNGVDYRDDESSISTVTLQREDDGQGFMTDSTIPDSSSMVSTQSTVSTMSTRSGITRQASTFRPLNSGMKSEKTRTRRRHRKTVVGIPQHVQRELGLDRRLSNGETADIPTIAEPQQAPEAPDGGGVGIHKDVLALLQLPGQESGSQQRPHSLAVPWMTTGGSLQQHPPSPVMSMSPQATYLSKIIPNAVMPPSIDVVEISRGRSRNSVRTVSKSSLLPASPAASRASSRASSSKASTISSASRYNPPYFSDSSGWSRSCSSSETLVSDSSTISSSSTPRQRSQQGDGGRLSQGGFAKDDQVSVYSSVSKASKPTSNGKPGAKEGVFARSLSVTKSKRAPPPPNRSYSLHNKVKRRSRELRPGESCLDGAVASEEAGSSPMSTKVADNTGYTADTSSLDDSTGSTALSPAGSRSQASDESIRPKGPAAKDSSPEKQQRRWENGLGRAASPSSGYSSQGGTPAQPSDCCPYPAPLPKHKKSFLAKIQSFFPGSSSTMSPLTQAEPGARPVALSCPAVGTTSASPSVSVLRDLFNIPPPPKVRAPPPPPPEVWAYSKRTFELLLGPPAPNDIHAIVKKNPKDRRVQRCSPAGSREGSVKSLTVDRNQKNAGGHLVQDTKENTERLQSHVSRVEVGGNDEAVSGIKLINVTSLKGVGRDERIAATRREAAQAAPHPQISVTEIKKTMDTLSAIKLARGSPSSSPLLTQHAPLPAGTQAAPPGIPDPPSTPAPEPVLSPWLPPPPPPTDQTTANLCGSDEMDFPPPPPLEESLPPTAIVQESSSHRVDSQIIPVAGSVECLRMAAAAAAAGSVSEGKRSPHRALHVPQLITALPRGIPPPPQTIPPPPPSAVPFPPVKTQKAAPPPATKVSPPPDLVAQKVSAPPPATTVCPPPDLVAQKVSAPPPGTKVSPPPDLVAEKAAPPPATTVSPPPDLVAEKAAPPPATTVSPPPDLVAEKAAPPPATTVCPPPDLVAEKVSAPPPAEKATPPSADEVPPLRDEKVTSAAAGEVVPLEATTSSTGFLSPESVPPPAPTLPQEPSPSQSTSAASVSDVAPLPRSIRPPSPSKLLHPPAAVVPSADGGRPSAQNLASPPPADVPVPTTLHHIVAPAHAPAPPESVSSSSPPQPVLDPATDAQQTEPHLPSGDQVSPSAPEQDPIAVVSPSLLQTVELKSVSSGSYGSKAQNQASSTVTMREQRAKMATSGEPPQKPIRRSLIMTSPMATPETEISQQATVKAQATGVVLPTPSPHPPTSPSKKSTPAVSAAPSMNMQEAIRLRTAARSKDGPPSRLSLQSPASPPGGSPSSMASFIFSKSAKKVVIDTASAPEAQVSFQRNLVAELSSVSKPDKDAESQKMGLKMPPPVAKKPKGKTKETEEMEDMQTAGQNAQPESTEGTQEKPNGTAGAVEGRQI